jgi:hypothetical protein
MHTSDTFKRRPAYILEQVMISKNDVYYPFLVLHILCGPRLYRLFRIIPTHSHGWYTTYVLYKKAATTQMCCIWQP